MSPATNVSYAKVCRANISCSTKPFTTTTQAWRGTAAEANSSKAAATAKAPWGSAKATSAAETSGNALTFGE
jgi:hypothetical protein